MQAASVPEDQHRVQVFSGNRLQAEENLCVCILQESKLKKYSGSKSQGFSITVVLVFS